VLGDPLDLIASGPTVPDTSTRADAWEVVQRYELTDKLPKNVLAVLKNSELRDSPSPDHPVFSTAETILVGNNALAVDAAAKEAEKLGYCPVVLGTQIEGEAKEIATFYTRMALYLQQREGKETNYAVAPSLPIALLAGGETTGEKMLSD
jgi:glycerate-2-kinase